MDVSDLLGPDSQRSYDFLQCRFQDETQEGTFTHFFGVSRSPSARRDSSTTVGEETLKGPVIRRNRLPLDPSTTFGPPWVDGGATREKANRTEDPSVLKEQEFCLLRRRIAGRSSPFFL